MHFCIKTWVFRPASGEEAWVVGDIIVIIPPKHVITLLSNTPEYYMYVKLFPAERSTCKYKLHQRGEKIDFEANLFRDNDKVYGSCVACPILR